MSNGSEDDGRPTCLSVCSGIGGLDEGLRRAGFRHVGLCESVPYRRDVLRVRFPGVPIWDDIRDVGVEPATRAPKPPGRPSAGATGGLHSVAVPTLVAGGTPCQDLSVAGRRAGLHGERSGLFFEFARVVDAFRPEWLLWENVPGALSSHGGRDFGVVLGTLADIGYGLAWRIVDSRYFGVPQRRRRVFVVGARADGDPRAAAGRAAQVLAVGARCGRHPASRGETGPDVASPLGGSVGDGRGHDGNPFDRGGRSSLSGLGSGGADDNDAQAGRLVTVAPEVAYALADGSGTRPGSGRDAQDTLIAETVWSHPRPGSNSNGNLTVAAPLTKGSATGEGVNQPGCRQEDDVNLVATGFHMLQDPISETELAPAWGKGNKEGTASIGMQRGASVRRLTPTECERLQGLDDNWTAPEELGGPGTYRRGRKRKAESGEEHEGWVCIDGVADGKRYAALGDAVTATVAHWLGDRILRG